MSSGKSAMHEKSDCLLYYYVGNKGTVVKGLVPLKTHQISVIAVYKDGIEERGHTEYIHTGLSVVLQGLYLAVTSHFYTARITPAHVSANLSEYTTTVHWKFDEGLETRMKHFDIEVFPDMFCDQTQVHTSPASSRAATISGLASGTAHSMRVTAVYYDDTRAESDVIHFTTPGTPMH